MSITIACRDDHSVTPLAKFIYIEPETGKDSCIDVTGSLSSLLGIEIEEVCLTWGVQGRKSTFLSTKVSRSVGLRVKRYNDCHIKKRKKERYLH